MGFMDFMKQPTSNTTNSNGYKPYEFKEEDLYNIEKVLEKLNINKKAFFAILRIAKIANRRTEFMLLEYLSMLTPEKINYIAEEIRKLKADTKK